MKPEQRYPTPADLAPAAPWQDKRLLTAEQQALMVPQQPRRRVVLPAVVRPGRRTGRRSL